MYLLKFCFLRSTNISSQSQDGGLMVFTIENAPDNKVRRSLNEGFLLRIYYYNFTVLNTQVWLEHQKMLN